MSIGTHERPGLFARFRRQAPVTPPPAVHMGSPAYGTDVYLTPEVRATLDRLRAAAEAETAPWAPLDRPDGDVPHSEPEAPLEYEYQSWYGWGLTLPDNRAPMAREYVPEPYTPDLCADLADLAIFREALSLRTRCHAGECLCGHPVTGETWGERMVRAGIHLLTGNEAAA